MNNVVVGGVRLDNLLFLVTLLLQALFGVLHIVLFLLRHLLGLLVLAALVEGGETCLQALYLALHGRKLRLTRLLALIENLLYETVLAVENQTVRVGHLSVEIHSALITADVLHPAHILVLRDDHRSVVLAHGLHLDDELHAVNLGQLGAERG